MICLKDLATPALVVDLDKLETNIERMATKARRLDVSLRPHIKTHKCVEIAELQRAAGCHGITCSTLQEVKIFADHGFTDLTWAFPLILNQAAFARELAERVTLRLLVDSVAAIDALESDGFPFHVWLKVDCGYHRAGVDPGSPLAYELAQRISESNSLQFDGLLTHSGHAYKAESVSRLQEVAEEERQVMDSFASQLRQQQISVPAVSVGSTPAMSVVEDLNGIDEARPGNYVFYDQMQVDLGACAITDCAATVLASVVSSQPGAGHCVVDAGALAMSKDPGSGRSAVGFMGGVYRDYESGTLRENVSLGTLSQEHGILSDNLPVGDQVRILPHHSCLTVACFRECAVARGDQVVDRWRIWSGR